jgi:predicted RNA polymerase sigma factor
MSFPPASSSDITRIGVRSHAIHGELLLELGQREQAQAAELQALALTGNRAEQSLLQQRLSAESTEKGASHAI